MACMAAKPIVDGLETEFQNELQIVHLNVQDEQNRDLMKQYGFQYTPTFVFIDDAGEELWRTTGAVDPERVRQTMETLK